MQALFLVITREHAGRDLHRRPALRAARPEGAAEDAPMSILRRQPPADPSAAAAEIKLAPERRLPGPLLFVGRAVRTLWSNGKARIGLVILALFILMALLRAAIAPHSPTATTFTPYQGPSGDELVRHDRQRPGRLLPARVRRPGVAAGRADRRLRRDPRRGDDRPDLRLPAGCRRRGAQLRHQPGARHPRPAADDHPGGVHPEPLDLDHRPRRRLHQLGHRRPGDPQPGGHAAHPRLRHVGGVLRRAAVPGRVPGDPART